MNVIKWVGIVFVSIVMGMVCGGFALLAEPSVSMAIRVALEIIGTAVVLHQMIGMLHLVDRFLVFMLAEFAKAPMPQHAGMQEILIDRRQLVLQHFVEDRDDFFITLHLLHSRP